MICSIGPSTAALVFRLGGGLQQPSYSSSSLSAQESEEIDGIVEDLEEMRKTWEQMHALVADAEKRQLGEKSVRSWLLELRGLADKIQDLLDEYEYEVVNKHVNSPKDLEREPAAAGISKKRELGKSTIPSPIAPLFDAPFRRKFAGDLRKIMRRFEWISKQRDVLQLKESNPNDPFTSRPPTTLLPNDSVFVGREEKLELLEEKLLSYNHLVVAVVGIGGVGKTTLARHAYEEHAHEFNVAGWVHVSQSFDAISVTKAVIGSLTKRDCSGEGLPLSVFQDEVVALIRERKLFLVLDDLWNIENNLEWDTFVAPFLRYAREGSKILITTQFGQVAVMAGVTDPIRVGGLDEGAGWKVLRKHAFPDEDCEKIERIGRLESIGRLIVRNCGGLPLALKLIGFLLRSKGSHIEKNWRDIVDGSLLDFEGGHEYVAQGILGSLYPTYVRLSPKLKACFMLSAASTDWKCEEGTYLEKLLMSYNIVNDHKEARRCLEELQDRNLLHFSMHEIILKLAGYVNGEKIETACAHGIMHLAGTRHVRYVGRSGANLCNLCECLSRLEESNSAPFFLRQSLRSLYVVGSPGALDQLFIGLKCLRILVLKGYDGSMTQICNLYNLWYLDLTLCKIKRLPKRFCNLKNLRWLNFSGSSIESLPEAISALVNLKELVLKDCKMLEKLTRDIVNLTNLETLNCTGSGISYFPKGIGNLANLQSLSDFYCATGEAAGLSEMKGMNHLQDEITIHGLGNVRNEDEAREAEMYKKNRIWKLKLVFSSNMQPSSDLHEKILDHLRPHNNIKELHVREYKGSKLSSWMGSKSYAMLATLRLENIFSCESVSPVHKLPSLECLFLSHMRELSQLVPPGDELNGPVRPGTPFPQLISLSITSCGKLHTLSLCNFISISYVNVNNCQNLECINIPPQDANLHDLAITIAKCHRFCDQSKDPAWPNPWSLYVF